MKHKINEEQGESVAQIATMACVQLMIQNLNVASSELQDGFKETKILLQKLTQTFDDESVIAAADLINVENDNECE